MLRQSKNKIIVGLLSMALVLLFALGALFYTFSSNVSGIAMDGSKTNSEFVTAKADAPSESNEGHFSIFSILNKFLSN